MNRIMKVAIALVCLAAAGRQAYAADNGTEFGVEDDLTVLGTGGTAVDPDLEVKGFTVFGSTQGSPALNIPVTPGNIFANGYVQVSSGMYVAGSSTFTAGAYFTGVSSFAAGPGSIYVSGGAPDQVLKKVAGGGMAWADVSGMVSGDNLGNHIATTTLNMSSFDIKNANYVTASSAALSGQLVVYGTSTLTGLVGMGGALNVDGDVDLNARLNVDLSATFVSSVTAKGDTRFGDAVTNIHGVNMAPAADTALSVAGQNVSGDYAAKFYTGASLAAWIKKK